MANSRISPLVARRANAAGWRSGRVNWLGTRWAGEPGEVGSSAGHGAPCGPGPAYAPGAVCGPGPAYAPGAAWASGAAYGPGGAEAGLSLGFTAAPKVAGWSGVPRYPRGEPSGTRHPVGPRRLLSAGGVRMAVMQIVVLAG